MTNNFDRLGRSPNAIDAAGTNSSGTPLGTNLRFDHGEYQLAHEPAWYVTNTSLLNHSFTFDGASRITNVSDGTYQAGYS